MNCWIMNCSAFCISHWVNYKLITLVDGQVYPSTRHVTPEYIDLNECRGTSPNSSIMMEDFHTLSYTLSNNSLQTAVNCCMGDQEELSVMDIPSIQQEIKQEGDCVTKRIQSLLCPVSPGYDNDNYGDEPLLRGETELYNNSMWNISWRYHRASIIILWTPYI